MSENEARARPSMLVEVVAELERSGADRPVEVARRLGPGGSEVDVRVAPAELLRDGVVAYNGALGVCWWAT